MSDLNEISENYQALLRMADIRTAADVLLFRTDEIDEQTMLDVIYTLKGELMMRECYPDE